MSDIHEETIKMTPQISPKDIPQDRSESEEEEEPVYGDVGQESSSSHEEDEEDIAPQGYVPLSMNDANESPETFLQDSEEENIATEGNENQEAQVNESSNEAVSLPVNQENIVKEPPMNNDQVNLIQQVMSRISLPSSSIPEWANVIPEDKWKKSLLTSLEKRTHSTSSANCNETDPEK